jgi:hypothetical protein
MLRPRKRTPIVHAMLLSALLVLGLVAPASADDATDATDATELQTSRGEEITCEGSNGWSKHDTDTGSETGDFGTFSWEDRTFSYDLHDGYALEFCIRHGRNGTGPPPSDDAEFAAQFKIYTGAVAGSARWVSSARSRNTSAAGV